MENAKDTFRYENLDRDLKTLKPVERPCVLAGMLCGRLGILTIQAEHHEDGVWRKNAALSIGMIVDLLQRLSMALDDTSILLALREVHEREGRKVCVAGKWYGSHCVATREIGREYYCAIYEAADFLEYGKWLLANARESRGYEPLPAATIEGRWPEITETILKLTKVGFDELDLGITSEHLAVRRTQLDCYVTKLQMSAIVNRSERTIRRLYDAGTLPAPAVQGGEGKPSEWRWDDVRPILEKEYKRELPPIFPAHQFVRS